MIALALKVVILSSLLAYAYGAWFGWKEEGVAGALFFSLAFGVMVWIGAGSAVLVMLGLSFILS